MKKYFELKAQAVQVVRANSKEDKNDYNQFRVVFDEKVVITQFLTFSEKIICERQLGMNFDKYFTEEINCSSIAIVSDKTKFNNYIGLEIKLVDIPYTIKIKISDDEIGMLKMCFEKREIEATAKAVEKKADK